MSVSANMAYPASIYNGKQITSEQSLSKYGFCYLGESAETGKSPAQATLDTKI